MIVDDPKKVVGTLDGNTLKIEAAAGFIFGRINRQEILKKLCEAAERLSGSPVRTAVSELKESSGLRKLEELQAYPEVKFI